MGAKSQTSGATWEKAIVAECAREFARARATIERRTPPMAILKALGRGRFECVHAKLATVDFIGVMGGRAVAFDAKHSQTATRFDFASVRDGQLEYLARYARCGGVAFLYVLSSPTDGRSQTRWVLPVCARARIAGIAHARSHEALVGADMDVSVRFDALDAAMQVAAHETWVDAVCRLEATWWAKGVA